MYIDLKITVAIIVVVVVAATVATAFYRARRSKQWRRKAVIRLSARLEEQDDQRP